MENPRYDVSLGAAVGVFEGYLSFEQFKEIAEELHRIRVRHKCAKQLNDIKEMRVLSPEIVDWLQATWFPKAIETGLKHFAFLVPKSAIASLSMKSANDGMEAKTGIQIKYFGDENEARDWLKQQ